MKEFIKNTLSMGLGVVDFTEKEGRKIIQELVHRGELKKGEGSHLLSRLLHRAEESKQDFEQRVEKSVTKIFSKLELVQKKDFDRAIKRLERKVGACCRQTGTKSKKNS